MKNGNGTRSEIDLTDYPPAPRRAVVRTTASVANHPGKRPKKLISLPPLPAAMLNGMKLPTID